jgi:GTP cyclohydrolase III
MSTADLDETELPLIDRTGEAAVVWPWLATAADARSRMVIATAVAPTEAEARAALARRLAGSADDTNL